MSDVDDFQSDSAATGQEADGPPSAPVADVLLPARRVAASFGTTLRMLRNWEQRGWLLPVRIGRSVFYRPSDIEALAECGAPAPASIAVSASTPAPGVLRSGDDDALTSAANQGAPAVS